MASIEQIMGPVGFLLSTAMYSTCISVVRDMRKRQGVGEWSCVPYMVQQFNGYLWATYAMALDPVGLIWVLAANSVGVAFAAVASWFFIYYCTAEQRSDTLKKMAGLYAYMIGLAVYVFMNRDDSITVGAVGYVATAAAMIMYCGPAVSLVHACRERTTEFIPLALGIFSLTNGTVWSIYGIGVGNIYVYACNLVGAAVALIQIATYVALTYACKKNVSATTESTINDSHAVPDPVGIVEKDLENVDLCLTPETRSSSHKRSQSLTDSLKLSQACPF